MSMRAEVIPGHAICLVQQMSFCVGALRENPAAVVLMSRRAGARWFDVEFKFKGRLAVLPPAQSSIRKSLVRCDIDRARHRCQICEVSKIALSL